MGSRRPRERHRPSRSWRARRVLRTELSSALYFLLGARDPVPMRGATRRERAARSRHRSPLPGTHLGAPCLELARPRRRPAPLASRPAVAVRIVGFRVILLGIVGSQVRRRDLDRASDREAQSGATSTSSAGPGGPPAALGTAWQNMTAWRSGRRHRRPRGRPPATTSLLRDDAAFASLYIDLQPLTRRREAIAPIGRGARMIDYHDAFVRAGASRARARSPAPRGIIYASRRCERRAVGRRARRPLPDRRTIDAMSSSPAVVAALARRGRWPSPSSLDRRQPPRCKERPAIRRPRADGDLTVDTGVDSRDELGQMAASLSTAQATLATRSGVVATAGTVAAAPRRCRRRRRRSPRGRGDQRQAGVVAAPRSRSRATCRPSPRAPSRWAPPSGRSRRTPRRPRGADEAVERRSAPRSTVAELGDVGRRSATWSRSSRASRSRRTCSR